MKQMNEIIDNAIAELQKLKTANQEEKKETKWMDKIGNGFYITGDNLIGTYSCAGQNYIKVFREFKEKSDALDYAAWLTENAKRIYAQYALQTILERDYMPEPVDWGNHEQTKYFIFYDYSYMGWRAGSGSSVQHQGIIYCTARPDLNYIIEQMGELLEALL